MASLHLLMVEMLTVYPQIENIFSHHQFYLIFCCWFPICWPHSTWFTCCCYPIFSFFCFCATACNANFWVISTLITFRKRSVYKPNSGGQFRCFHYIGTYKASQREENSEPIVSVIIYKRSRGSHIKTKDYITRKFYHVGSMLVSKNHGVCNLRKTLACCSS